MKYKVVAVIWEDHREVRRQPIINDPENLIFPTITIGILLKKTKRILVIVSDIERSVDDDQASYLIIFRSNILAVKEFGELEIDNLRISA